MLGAQPGESMTPDERTRRLGEGFMLPERGEAIAEEHRIRGKRGLEDGDPRLRVLRGDATTDGGEPDDRERPEEEHRAGHRITRARRRKNPMSGGR